MDNILIENLEIYAYHGVNPEENTLGQKFIISLSLFVDTQKAGQADDLTKSVNYAEVCHFAEQFLQQQQYQLIESCAEQLAKAILQHYALVQKIKLTIKKPWAPIGCHVDYAGITITRSRHIAYIGIGSNIGDKEQNITTALQSIETETTHVVKVSSYYETTPWGGVEQDTFLNCTAAIETTLSPLDLLHHLQTIETTLKRERNIHWGPRTIDLDILLYDDLVTDTPELVLPHPYMEQRLFVLVPLAEIAPYVIHPLLQQRIFILKKQLEQTETL